MKRSSSHLGRNPHLASKWPRLFAICALCEGIDFPRYFAPKSAGTGISMTSLAGADHFLECHECTLCKHIQTRIRATGLHFGTTKATVQLKRVPADQSEYLRADSIACYRMQMVLNAKGSRIVLDTLDLVESYPQISCGNFKYRMQREPVAATFDVALLSQWTQTSVSLKAKKTATIHNVGSGLLQPLMDLGKFRLLDVHSCRVLCLVNSTPYFALSYLWGSSRSNAVKKHISSSEDYAWSIEFLELPRTIRDAIRLVRDSGQQYLWVDSLCINQQDVADVAPIVSEMGAIYSEATLTIVAASGIDAEAGLMRYSESESEEAPEKPLEVKQTTRHIRLLPSRKTFEQQLTSTEWRKRGWTFQEDILSKTAVYFLDTEVHFRGAGFSEREAYMIREAGSERGLKRYSTKKKVSTIQDRLYAVEYPSYRMGYGSLWSDYQNLVKDYTARELTYPGDKLDAFIGILTSMARANSTVEEGTLYPLEGLVLNSGVIDRYEARQFGAYLLWRHDFNADAVPTRIRSNAYDTHQLPSWSWVGWSGRANYEETGSRPSEDLSGIAIDSKNVQIFPNLSNFPSYQHSRTLPRVNWPYTPMVNKDGIRMPVMLHFWAPILKAQLHFIERRSGQRPDGPGCWHQIMLQHKDRPLRYTGDIRLSGIVDSEEIHEFLCLGVSLEFPNQLGQWLFWSTLMLVQPVREGGIYERVALSNSVHTKDDIITPDDLVYQHVKLI